MGKQNKYDSLESQIGDAGSVPNETLSLGKIRHPEVLGEQPDLNRDELKSFEDFKSRSYANRQKRAIEAQAAREKEIMIEDGWVPLDRSELGERSQFYPMSWEFFIKPASVMSIKNWTAVDETKPDQVNRVMNEIIKSSVKIDAHDVNAAGWQSINSWDRFWFILKVRELTFTKGDYKIEFEDTCSECGEDLKYELKPSSLGFDCPNPEDVKQYWNGKYWEINPYDYDVVEDNGKCYGIHVDENTGATVGENLKLYIPTIGKDNAIIEWATERVQNQQTIDQTFIKFLSWLLPSVPPKDSIVRNKIIQRIYKTYKEDWGPVMFNWVDEAIDTITVIPSENLVRICPHCGMEAHSQVRFPNGIKALFRTQSTAKKFGRRSSDN